MKRVLLKPRQLSKIKEIESSLISARMKNVRPCSERLKEVSKKRVLIGSVRKRVRDYCGVLSYSEFLSL